MKSPRRWRTIAAEASTLASQSPSREGFVAICRMVERMAAADMDKLRQVAVPELREALKAWPNKLRFAPLLWINRLVRGALPIEALDLVSALSLTAALADRYIEGRHYALVRNWLAEYPADGPAPEGISISFRGDVADQLLAEMATEPATEFHPDLDKDGFPNQPHIDSSDFPIFFGSALLREVRVLDTSIEPSANELTDQWQGHEGGRGLRLGTVAKHIESKRLEAIDLWGQCWHPRDQLAHMVSPELGPKAMKELLGGVKALDIGGGHPCGDATLELLAKVCPALEELSLTPGPAVGRLLEGDGDIEATFDYEQRSYLRDEWYIEGNDDVDKMRISKAGWKALRKLPLRRVVLGTMHDGSALGDSVEVEHEPVYELSFRQRRVARWERFFDT